MSLRGKRLLITAGPTREFLDPIRFLTNASSGRLGLALAARAKSLGARVVVVLGPTSEKVPAGVKAVRVTTASEMLRACLRKRRWADIVIAAAAVGDWRFSSSFPHKIPKGGRPLRVTLVPNPDIVAELSRRRRPGQAFVGFALETRDEVKRARAKLARKGLDMIVANGPENLGSGRARFSVIDKDGGVRRFPPRTKSAAARAILKSVEPLLR